MMVSNKVRDIVIQRASDSCEICGRDKDFIGYSIHHRRPRGMGGTKRASTNDPRNLLLLCGSGVTGCHGLVESQRSHALACGWIVPQVVEPYRIPVNIVARGPVFLTITGEYSKERQPA